jgi:hypothetical protein
LEDVEAPEIASLNEAALDVEELEALLEIAVVTPNADCWTLFCCIIDTACGVGQ